MTTQNHKRSDFIARSLTRFIRHEAIPNILNLLNKSHPADIALGFSYCTEDERQYLWGLMANEKQRAEMLVEVESTISKEFLQDRSDNEVISLVEQLDPDDRVYLVSLLPEDRHEKVSEQLERQAPETSQILHAEKDTAGSIMTTQFLQIQETASVEEALKLVSSSRDDQKVFYLYVYITDVEGKLTGVVSLRELLQHQPASDSVKSVLHPEVYSAHIDMDQEEAARLVETYNLLALPVVKHSQEIVGIITVDDVIDVLSEEAEEDMNRFTGIGLEHQSHQESVFRSIHLRFPWLLAASVAGMLCMLVIHNFESALSKWWFLAIFIPAINGISGNVGVQASVIVIRSISTSAIDMSRVWSFFLKQIFIGTCLAMIFGVLIALVTYFFMAGPAVLPLTVGISLTMSIISSTLIGVFLPFVFHRFGIDPALAASPLVLSLVDITAVTLFFAVSSWMLTLQI